MKSKIVAKCLLVFEPGIDLVGVTTKPSGIYFRQVNMGFAIDNPVDELMAQTTTHENATCKSFSEP